MPGRAMAVCPQSMPAHCFVPDGRLPITLARRPERQRRAGLRHVYDPARCARSRDRGIVVAVQKCLGCSHQGIALFKFALPMLFPLCLQTALWTEPFCSGSWAASCRPKATHRG